MFHAIGFIGTLTAMLVALKLDGAGLIASWSWWQVFSPVLVMVGLGLVVAAVHKPPRDRR